MLNEKILPIIRIINDRRVNYRHPNSVEQETYFIRKWLHFTQLKKYMQFNLPICYTRLSYRMKTMFVNKKRHVYENSFKISLFWLKLWIPVLLTLEWFKLYFCVKNDCNFGFQNKNCFCSFLYRSLKFLQENTNHIICLNIFDQFALRHSDAVSRRRFDIFE